MTSVINVRTELKAILDSLVSAGTIEVAYNYQPAEIGTTIAASLVFKGGAEEYVDSKNNEFIMDFIIRPMAERPKDDSDLSSRMTKLLTATDAIVTELRQDTNFTLNGNVHYLKVLEVSEVFQDKTGGTEVMYQEIKVRAKTLGTTS